MPPINTDFLDQIELQTEFRGHTVGDFLRGVRPKDNQGPERYKSPLPSSFMDPDEDGDDISSFSRGRTPIRAGSTSRSFRGGSAFPDLAEEDFNLNVPTISRSFRAGSVLPASLKHFEDLADAQESRLGFSSRRSFRGGSAIPEDFEVQAPFSNSGLNRARSALSEARVLASGLSQSKALSRDYDSYESVDRSRSKRSALSRDESSYAAGGYGANSGTSGNYNINVTIDHEPMNSGKLFSGSRGISSTTSSLLKKYSGRQFPDFNFGSYRGSNLNEPVSSGFNYNKSSLFDDEMDSSNYSRRGFYGKNSASNGYAAFDSGIGSGFKKSVGFDLGNQRLGSSFSKMNKSSKYSSGYDSSSMNLYNRMAANYGLSTEGTDTDNYFGRSSASKESRAAALQIRRSGRPKYDDPLDEAARAYLDKYGVDLESKASKYYDDEADEMASSSFARGASGRRGYEPKISLADPSVLSSKYAHLYIPNVYDADATPMPVRGTRRRKFGWKS